MRLNSSTQPVSSTISRMPSPFRPVPTKPSRRDHGLEAATGNRRHRAQDAMNLGAGGIDAARAIHQEMRARALFRIRHLLVQYGLKLRLRHAGALERPGALEL